MPDMIYQTTTSSDGIHLQGMVKYFRVTCYTRKIADQEAVVLANWSAILIDVGKLRRTLGGLVVNLGGRSPQQMMRSLTMSHCEVGEDPEVTARVVAGDIPARRFLYIFDIGVREPGPGFDLVSGLLSTMKEQINLKDTWVVFDGVPDGGSVYNMARVPEFVGLSLHGFTFNSFSGHHSAFWSPDPKRKTEREFELVILRPACKPVLETEVKRTPRAKKRKSRG